MTTKSEPLSVARDAYVSDDERPAKASIEGDATTLADQATDIANYDTSPTPPASDATIQDLLAWVNSYGYTGLTDAQIEQVVEYRAEVLAQSEALQQLAQQQQQNHEQLLQQNQQIAQDMADALNAALQLHPNFEVVTDNEQTQAQA